MLTRQERISYASQITEAMREAYEAEGETGDFEDGNRYLRDDASDEELLSEYHKWVK